MKQLIAILLIALLANNHTNGQHVFTNSGTSFSNSTSFSSTTFPAMPKVKRGEPRIDYWTEFGDGNFSFSASPTHNFRTARTIKAVSKATGIYIPPPPPGIMLSQAISLSTNVTPGANTDDYVKLKGSSVSEVGNVELVANNEGMQANDEMYFAVNYRISDINANWKLVIDYDENMFKVITSNENLHTYLTGTSAPNYPNVTRAHYFEAVSFPTNAPTTHKYNYNNFIEWVIGERNDSIHTVFFTLLPLPGATSGSTTVNAKLVNTTTNEEENSQLEFVARPHDPNYEIVTPICNLMPTKAKKILPYKVHFQNEGAGPATRVIVTTTLPKGVDLTNAAQLAVLKSSLKWKIGNDPVVNFPSAGLSSIGTNYILDLKIFEKIVPNKIELTFTKRSTATVLSPFDIRKGLSDVSTMGEFSFNIQTNNLFPNMLASYSSIVFSSGDAPKYKDEEPILTDPTITEFKNNCNCDNNNSNNGNNGGPTKPRCKFLRWLFCKECK
jgi:hypothetical protein